MAQFLRHVGKVGDRKVAVIFREIPSETHMALVVYTELLNSNIHDPLIAAIESPQGQASKDLADALNRTYTKDGKIILHVLHTEGMMKKIQTSQVVMTPAPGSTIRLNELNTMLDEMEKGEEAVKRLADLDKQSGLQTKKTRQGREVGMPPNNTSVSRTNIDVDPSDSAAAYLKGVLTDSDLAEQRKSQAEKMKEQAKQLLAEAQRLETEANELSTAKDVKATKSKKATPTKKQAA